MCQVGDAVIGTHFLDLSTISNDGEKGIYPIIKEFFSDVVLFINQLC